MRRQLLRALRFDDPNLETEGRAVVDRLSWRKIDDVMDVYKRASPASYVDKNDAPTITLHGTADPLVPYSQAVLVDKVLHERGVVSELVPVEGAGHGWWGGEIQRTQRRSIEFLDKHLKGKAAATVSSP